MKLTMTLNGERREFDVPANISLLSLLRNEAGCFSVKHGCETGECGACAILLDGKVVNSCILLAAQADEREIITLEGLPWISENLRKSASSGEEISTSSSKQASPRMTPEEEASRSSFQNPDAFSREEHPTAYEALHPIQRAFVDTHAIQCGYCTPGMILSTLALFVEKGLLDLPSVNTRRKARRPLKRKTRLPLPTELEIRDALAGNLCRCTGYVKPVEAAIEAAKELSS